MTVPEEKPETEMDEIVTETYDKSLHLGSNAPRLDPPGVSTPSVYDKEDDAEADK